VFIGFLLSSLDDSCDSAVLILVPRPFSKFLEVYEAHNAITHVIPCNDH
jgi:hypothetical protein